MARHAHLAIIFYRCAVVGHIRALEDNPGNRDIAGAQGFQREQRMVDGSKLRTADKDRR